MPKIPLRFLAPLSPSYVDACAADALNFEPRINCQMPGLLAKALHLALRNSSFEYSLVRDNLPQINGSMFDVLDRNEVDCFADVFLPVSNGTRLPRDRGNYVSTSLIFPFKYTFNLPVLNKTFLENAIDIVEVFPVDVWIVTTVSLLLMALLSFGFSRVRVLPLESSTADDYSRTSFWKFLELMVPGGGGPQTSFRLATVNLILVMMGVTVLLFTNLYQGMLLGQLLNSKGTTPFGNFEELLNDLRSNRLHLIDADPQWYFPLNVRTSMKPKYVAIREALKDNPFVFEKNMSEMLKKVAFDGSYAWYGWAGAWSISKNVPGSDVCKMKEIDIALTSEPKYGGMLCRKDFAYTQNISRLLDAMIDEIYGSYNAYWGDTQQFCRRQRLERATVIQPLTIMQFVGVFVLFLGGLLIALTLCAFEACAGVCKTRTEDT